MFKVVLFGLMLFLSVSVYADIDSDMNLFSQSIAAVDDISAGFINPAGLGVRYVMAFRYIHAFPDSTIKGDNGGALATNGNMVSAQWLNHTNGKFRRKFMVASGKPLVANLYWGLSFAYFNGSGLYKSKKVWKLGFVYNPLPRAWFGITVDDLNRPKFDKKHIERLYTLAAAYKSLTNKAQFSVDIWNSERTAFNKLKAKLRFEIRLKSSYQFAFQYKTDGEFEAGLAINFNYVGLGYGSRHQRNEFRGGNFYYNQKPVEGSR